MRNRVAQKSSRDDPVTEFPLAPVRRIVKRSHRGYVCLFPSRKSSAPIECESLLELDFVRLVEADPDVTSIVHQPREIKWSFDGEIRTHVPDFALVYKGRLVIVEVKLKRKAAESVMRTRTKIITDELAEHGILYRILTETFIRREPQLSLAKLALRGLGQDPLPNDRTAVMALLAPHPKGLTTADVARQLDKPLSFVNAIFALALCGDLCLPVSPDGSSPTALDAVVKIRGRAS